MCRETLLIYPRCGHPKSSMGAIYHCPAYLHNGGRTCVNAHGQPHKGYEFHIEDTRTQRLLDDDDDNNNNNKKSGGLPALVSFTPAAGGGGGGWKAEIAKGYKGYCGNCVEGRTEPMRKAQREDFLLGYLGEHARWEKERKEKRKLAVEQERLMERFKRENGKAVSVGVGEGECEGEGWVEGE